MAYMLIYLLKKCECKLDIVQVLTRTINILTTNELVKLTTLNNWAQIWSGLLLSTYSIVQDKACFTT